ncbi:MAG: hypothetical protein PVF27_04990 [Gemmatimonadales bacterium]
MTWRRVFRWRAIVPLVLFLVLLGTAWLLLLDTLVERGVERTGAYLVGAKVDLESADVRLSEGAVTLRGLAVANPNAPMTNLLEAEVILADVRMGPLLERRVAVETLAVRGVQFHTPRETSGALRDPSPGSGRVAREVSQWAESVEIPAFSLAGLGQVVNVGAIDPDSLGAIQAARGVAGRADSLDERWAARLRQLDPGPVIDSADALAQRLEAADRRRLGVTEVANLARSARGTLQQVEGFRVALARLDSTAAEELRALRSQVSRLADVRQADYAYARGLLRLPAISGPELSPALFGEAAVGWLEPVLYWLRLAEQYLPPGLDPRRFAGSNRVRARGTTVRYPGATRDPRFLLEHADVDLAIGGVGAAAGSYVARVTGLTSDPALYGKPLEVLAERADAAAGPRSLRVVGVLDHVRRPITDSLNVLLEGFTLPAIDLAGIGARLLPGAGETRLSLTRSGEHLTGHWWWRTDAPTWQRDSARAAVPTGGAPALQQRAETLLWNTLSGLPHVEIEVEVGGSVQRPSIALRSNVGTALAQALRDELGRELERAEQDVRARVDALVQGPVERAEQCVADVSASFERRIRGPRQELERLEARIREGIQRLTGGLPIP